MLVKCLDVIDRSLIVLKFETDVVWLEYVILEDVVRATEVSAECDEEECSFRGLFGEGER